MGNAIIMNNLEALCYFKSIEILKYNLYLHDKLFKICLLQSIILILAFPFFKFFKVY